MAVLNGLPVYYITIQEDLSSNTGIDFISLVDYPAIEQNWVAMGDHKSPMRFATIEDRQLLCGPILIPNLPIYRYDSHLGEYYVVFTEKEIEKLVRKFQASQKTINLNYQHQKDSQLKQAVVQEIWLTGVNDKSKDMGFDLPVGSGFVCSYIGDKDFWLNEVKTGNVRGYSIEGFLDMEMKKIKNKNNMSSQKFVSAMTDKGVEVKSDSEVFTVGAEVYTEVDGVKAPAPDGDHMLDNGMMIKVVDGKISEIVEVEMSQGEIEIIQNALKPMFAAYEARIKDLETKLENMPAAASATSTTDTVKKEVKMSDKEKVMTRFNILKKRSLELENKSTKN